MSNYGLGHKLGDNINTDYIISAKRKRDSLDMKELSNYLFEDIDPTLRSKINTGDYLVAGWNFGCGSSREFAPRVILNAGIKAVIAKSFGRIFYRNAISTGLALFVCDTSDIDDGDELDLDLEKGQLADISKTKIYTGEQLPQIMIDILKAGGLLNYLERNGDLII
jgi:3-isopropylmalate/(R)-2-methylmalate dehydratase small subunit